MPLFCFWGGYQKVCSVWIGIEAMSQHTKTLQQVERTAILERIGADIRQLAERSELTTPIINIHGIIGIGKTSLIQQLFDRFKQDYAVVLLNFHAVDHTLQPERARPWSGIINLLRQIPALSYLPDAPPLTSGSTPMDDDVYAVCDAALDQLPQKPLLLLLDALDDLPFWKWIQAQIIKPLLEQRRTLVVTTSQSPLFWHFWELREQCATFELEAFSLEETSQFLRQVDREALTKALYAVTGGYPLGLDQAVRLLERESDDVAASAQAVAINLTDLSVETREVVTYTGLLRRVEVPVMQQLLAHCLPHWATDLDVQRSIFTILAELRTKGYLETYQKGQPLRFIAVLRRVSVQQLCAQSVERYLDVCNHLASIYASQLMEKPVAEVESFNEWLYFSTAAFEHAADYNQQQLWQARLQQLFAQAKLAGPRLVARFYMDSDLLNRLRALDLFPVLQRLMHDQIDAAADVPIFSVAEITTYRRTTLQQLSERFQLKQRFATDVQQDLETFLRHIVALGPDFNAIALRAKINEGRPVGHGLLQAQVNATIAFLNSRGFFSYDRTRRKYHLQPLIRSLVPDPSHAAPPAVASWTDQTAPQKTAAG